MILALLFSTDAATFVRPTFVQPTFVQPTFVQPDICPTCLYIGRTNIAILALDRKNVDVSLGRTNVMVRQSDKRRSDKSRSDKSHGTSQPFGNLVFKAVPSQFLYLS
jgi:hypothetical protein